jgi:hypothetical protein
MNEETYLIKGMQATREAREVPQQKLDMAGNDWPIARKRRGRFRKMPTPVSDEERMETIKKLVKDESSS